MKIFWLLHWLLVLKSQLLEIPDPSKSIWTRTQDLNGINYISLQDILLKNHLGNVPNFLSVAFCQLNHSHACHIWNKEVFCWITLKLQQKFYHMFEMESNAAVNLTSSFPNINLLALLRLSFQCIWVCFIRFMMNKHRWKNRLDWIEGMINTFSLALQWPAHTIMKKYLCVCIYR